MAKKLIVNAKMRRTSICGAVETLLIDEKAINSASAAAVRGVPTVVVYKKGLEVARKVGGLPEQQMRDFLKENL